MPGYCRLDQSDGCDEGPLPGGQGIQAEERGGCLGLPSKRLNRGSVIPSSTQQSVWVTTHKNILVPGPVRLSRSLSALYTRAQSLFRDLAMARPTEVCAVCSPDSSVEVLLMDDCPWPRCQNPSAVISVLADNY